MIKFENSNINIPHSRDIAVSYNEDRVKSSKELESKRELQVDVLLKNAIIWLLHKP